MDDPDGQQPAGSQLVEKAGAVVTLAAAVVLAWIAIDQLRPRREDPDDDGS